MHPQPLPRLSCTSTFTVFPLSQAHPSMVSPKGPSLSFFWFLLYYVKQVPSSGSGGYQEWPVVKLLSLTPVFALCWSTSLFPRLPHPPNSQSPIPSSSSLPLGCDQLSIPRILDLNHLPLCFSPGGLLVRHFPPLLLIQPVPDISPDSCPQASPDH